ncbi:MAG: hypothetical protein JXC85_06250 [Candidatus Aenigmarchaeota archaeon]|nr:hypothetical protein [Candidatus Aenigmarchaeota archaeon]
MVDKPFYTEVVESKGKAIYVKGIRVFEHKDGTIHVTSSKGHTFCPGGSSIEKFFRKLLEEAK